MSWLGGALRGAQGGIGTGLAGFMGGARTEQAAYDAAQERQTKLGLALAQMRKAQGDADENDAKLELMRRRPELLMQSIAAQSGADVPTVRAVQQRIATGRLPTVPGLQGPTPEGPALSGEYPVAPEVQTRIARALANFGPLMANAGDIAPGLWAEALGKLRTNDLRDEVIAGTMPAATFGRAQAAAEGKPLVSGHEWGVVDNFGGAVDASSPVARRYGDYRTATTSAQQANARQSDAAAEASRAQAGKYLAETADGVNRSGAKAPAGYRWGPDGQTLEAIPGGPADPNTKGAKQSKPPTEGQAKALLFGSRMQLADEVLTDLENKGVKNPGAIVQATQGVVGALPVIGDKLSDAVDSSMNWTRSPDQQSVSQARRDFINAVLRRESGAVISPSEFANAERQYFPQVGDSPQVIRQKQANRRAAIEGMKADFGEAYMPEFNRILGEARKVSRPSAGTESAPLRQGGATGVWGGDEGWKVEKVR